MKTGRDVITVCSKPSITSKTLRNRRNLWKIDVVRKLDKMRSLNISFQSFKMISMATARMKTNLKIWKETISIFQRKSRDLITY